MKIFQIYIFYQMSGERFMITGPLVEPRCEKTVFGVSDQVRHNPGCIVTEDDERLENWIQIEAGSHYPCDESICKIGFLITRLCLCE